MQAVLAFDVGHGERHRVEFTFDRVRGGAKIFVDGLLADVSRQMFSFRLTRRFEFTVGHAERHAVRIEKRRKLLLAGFRPSEYHVFVDGQLVLSREM